MSCIGILLPFGRRPLARHIFLMAFRQKTMMLARYPFAALKLKEQRSRNTERGQYGNAHKTTSGNTRVLTTHANDPGYNGRQRHRSTPSGDGRVAQATPGYAWRYLTLHESLRMSERRFSGRLGVIHNDMESVDDISVTCRPV